MIELLKSKATIKIRFKRFNNIDFISRATKYLNINLETCTINEADKIVQFINRSNSKCHISYWILRTDLQLDEIESKLNEYKKSFVTSSYKYVTRKLTYNKFTKHYKSRGYSGYTTIRNTKYFCRSKNEFLALQYLDTILPKTYQIRYEGTVYVFGNISYKPDYFIYDECGKLVYVLEVKRSELDISEKYLYFQKELSKINITLKFLHSIHKLVKEDFNIKDKLIKWLEENKTQRINHIGRNNPRYGIKCSEYTKSLISQKAKERSTPEYTTFRIQNYIINRICKLFGNDIQFDSYEHLEQLLQSNLIYPGSKRYIKQSIKKYKKYFETIEKLNKQIKNKNNG